MTDTPEDDDFPAMASGLPDLDDISEGGEMGGLPDLDEPTSGMNMAAHNAGLPSMDEPSAPAHAAPAVGRRQAIYDVPVEVVVSVGRARPMIGSLMGMKRDTLIPLDSRMEDPVEIYVGDRVIARGELQELPEEDGRLGVRLTEIVEGGILA